MRYRAVIVSESSGFTENLKSFLFAEGFREILVDRDPKAILSILEKGDWPSVFLDHTPETTHCMIAHDIFLETYGLELLNYFYIVPSAEVVLHSVSHEYGAVDVLKRPITPVEAAVSIKKNCFSENEKLVAQAIEASVSMSRGDLRNAYSILLKLQKVESLKSRSELALARCEFRSGMQSRVVDRLKKMAEVNESARILKELSRVYSGFGMINESINCLERLREKSVAFSTASIELSRIFLDQGQFAQTIELLLSLQSDQTLKTIIDEFLSRIFLILRLQSKIGYFVRLTPSLQKRLSQHSLMLSKGA